jgi:hypothetical protein
MPSAQQSKGARGVVVAHVPDPEDHASEHERCTLLGFARRLAALLDYAEGGWYDASTQYEGHVFFVPASTLTSAEATALGIGGAGDLFGGVVPHPFVASKAISHPLVHAAAAAPAGWSADFAQQVDGAVLDGYTVFSLADAQAAGEKLLAGGPVRIKPVLASGGHGQEVVRDRDSLHKLLDRMADAGNVADGLVLERDLQELKTFSVGQVRVADLTATYFGQQRLTTNNDGRRVFGGSDLTVARGEFDALLALQPAAEIARAVEQARRYDAAVRACFKGFYASRSNYDVLLGRAEDGGVHSGVLEQSWRAGGATGPELAALEAFRAEPERRYVRTSCYEFFGRSPEPPAHASVYFRGTDPQLGELTKYTVVQADDDTR